MKSGVPTAFPKPPNAFGGSWPNTLLQHLAPAPNIGMPDHPLYEGTPLNFFAFLVSFPFAVVVYAAVAYVCLRRLKT